jgi:hypothetical protein
MRRFVASVAVGSVVAVLTAVTTLYVETSLRAAALEAGGVSDPYRMRRVIEDIPIMLVIATSVLLYYVLLASALMERYVRRRFGPLSKAALLSCIGWAAFICWSLPQSSHPPTTLVRSATLVALPLLLGGWATLRIMSSNTSLERTRDR